MPEMCRAESRVVPRGPQSVIANVLGNNITFTPMCLGNYPACRQSTQLITWFHPVWEQRSERPSWDVLFVKSDNSSAVEVCFCRRVYLYRVQQRVERTSSVLVNNAGRCASNSQYEEIESVALRNKPAITLTVSCVEAIKETGESAAHKHKRIS